MRYCGTAFQSGTPSGMRIVVTVGRRRAYVMATNEIEVNFSMNETNKQKQKNIHHD